MDKFIKVISAFDRWIAKLSGWIVFVMMLTITYDVGMRYLFRKPTTWSFEVNTYMLIAVVFLGGAWTLPAGGHVAVDIITERLKPAKKAILGVITSLMAMFYLAIFAITAFKFTYDAWANNIKSTQYLEWPLWPMRSFLLIGAVLLFFEFSFKLIRNIQVLKQKN